MCGIVYRKSFEGIAVNQSLLQLYKNQRSRGTQGFGFYIPAQDKLAHNPREDRILKLLRSDRYQASEILYHHRFPTSTANVQNACHPFSTRINHEHFEHEYVMVHNGWLTNDRELYKAHQAKGIQYASQQPDGSFNDSEALLYDLALYLDGKQESLEAEGAIAFIIIRDGEELFFGRNEGSPLHIKMDGRGIRLASEGAGASIQANMLYHFNEASKELETTPLDIPEYSYTYAGYDTGYVPSNHRYEYESWSKELSHYSQEVLDRANEELEFFEGDFESAADSIAGLINTLDNNLDNAQTMAEYDDTEARIKEYRKVIGAIYTLMWQFEEEAEEYERAYKTFKDSGAMA